MPLRVGGIVAISIPHLFVMEQAMALRRKNIVDWQQHTGRTRFEPMVLMRPTPPRTGAGS
jgi:hypothetical protein